MSSNLDPGENGEFRSKIMRSVAKRLSKKMNELDDGSEAKRYWRHVKNKKNIEHFIFKISKGKYGTERKNLGSKLNFLRLTHFYPSQHPNLITF